MTGCSFSPYEGKQAYCFISYAHRDSGKVIPILNELAQRGHRIWYDGGIAPGSEWPEYIAEHLNGSAVVIAFISPNSIDSANCRREITFALSKKKPFIGIFLCETEMSPGMEMQLSAQQCIMKYQIADESQFYDKLCGTDLFAVCHADEPDEPEQETETAAAAGSIDAEDMAAVARMQAAVMPQRGKSAKSEKQQAKAAQRAAREQAKARKRAVEREKKENAAGERVKEPVSLKKKILAIIAAALAVLAVLAFVILRSSNPYKTVRLTEGTIEISYSTASLKDEAVNDEAVKKLSKQKNITACRFTNCTITGDLSTLKYLAEYTSMYFYDCEVTDWSFLSGLTSLRRLEVVNSNITDEAVGFIDSGVMTVILSDCSGITGIAGLAVENLSTLDISGSPVSDISVLSDAVNLYELYIGNTTVTDLNPVAGLTTLQIINADNCELASPEPFMSLSLRKVSLRNCGLTNADFLQNATRLELLDLGGNHITAADWLTASAFTLKELYIDGNSFDNAWYANLSSLGCLQILDVSDLGLTDISFMENLEQVTELHAEDNALTDVSPLKGALQMKELYLQNNRITSADLTGMTALETLDLRNNQLTSAAGLPAAKITRLLLCGNQIPTDTLPDGLTGSYFVLDYTDITDGDLLTRDVYSRVVLVNCPANKQLDVSSLTGYKAVYIDETGVEQNMEEHGYDIYLWE